ncbi:MAG: LacI family DNA-binding transcriptional regulator [Ardenticatenaceae bacterium]|nr:LacI family DNA-binding transcriptional regulator [Ardenticatenaceae bacterium]MCB9445078.1 LacI family DNA-binding transcriptional regulator [Ardenticatenaceae bacterium]
MKDVAELAGVSRTTVSFVINKVPDSNIPPETQERVWTAVEELGYRPNVLAQGLRSQQTRTIGFISDEIATTPHAGRIIQGAQDQAWQHNNLILLVNTGGDQNMKKAAVDMMLDRQVDGLVYATMYHREVHPPEMVHQVPTVLLDCFVADRSLPSIIPDEVNGGRQATEFLLQKGHRRIGFINDIDPIPARYGRLQGYQQALAAYAISFDEELTVYQETDPAGGYDGAMALMKLSNPPTALFCFNDRMAMGAYDALRKLNLSIPDDVAIVGFDNQELISANLHPGLTTVALPHYEMGQWAVKKLLQIIDDDENGQESEVVQHMIDCPLVCRDSA